jgi:hypothetical protein
MLQPRPSAFSASVYLFVRVHFLPQLHDAGFERTLPQLRRRFDAETDEG